ncbi:unnamed protein product [Arabis nemorensis]|uniref:RING-type E3 ubiquitin transferase n=1 Tax=Arabis nemorensis TaxID=586526 RepID=A0A565CPW9_9BRAS|nr:unnamed protein product [Arabis nemorensis]
MSSETVSLKKTKKKDGLGWMVWLRGWVNVLQEILLQRIMASHLQNPFPLPSLNHLTCIVTGSTSGIGSETARQLAEAGAHVVMAVRNIKAAHELIQQWQTKWSHSGESLPLNIQAMELDLLSLDSVVRFSNAWNARLGPLHVLINNAGMFSMGGAQKFSKDGYEEHLQVNHLAPSLLSLLLLPSLIRASGSRIINVNSVMHYVGFVDPDDMNVVSGKRKFSSFIGYSSSKLAQVMFNNVLFKKLPLETGISVVCLSPGAVQTNVTRDLPRLVQDLYIALPYFIFSPQEGCRSSLFSATYPQIPKYCETLKTDDKSVCAFISQYCQPIDSSEEAQNEETSNKVWEKTIELIGLPVDTLERLIKGEEVQCHHGALELTNKKSFENTIAATVTCTNAVCRRDDPIIRFPFRLKSKQPTSCRYDSGFDLTCDHNAVNRTTITLAFSGKFTVEEIDYAAQEIWINDPNNCLPQRILTLNLSTTPFSGVYSRRFTFFNCPTSEYLRFRPLNPITCLSGKNSTVFATASPRVVNYLSSQSCLLMKTVEVPVRWPFYEQIVSSSDLSDNLWLTWRVPRCSECEIRGGKCGIKSNSSREIICSGAHHKPDIPRGAHYAIAIGAGIPGTLILFGLLCFVYSKINSCIKRRRLVPSLETNDTQAHSSQSNIIIMGLDGPTIESYPKIVLGESKRLPKVDDATCPICLSEYEPKETLRTIPLCQHCFHADCIDEWLKLNGTCPVCRNSPEQHENVDS